MEQDTRPAGTPTPPAMQTSTSTHPRTPQARQSPYALVLPAAGPPSSRSRPTAPQSQDPARNRRRRQRSRRSRGARNRSRSLFRAFSTRPRSSAGATAITFSHGSRGLAGGFGATLIRLRQLGHLRFCPAGNVTAFEHFGQTTLYFGAGTAGFPPRGFVRRLFLLAGVEDAGHPRLQSRPRVPSDIESGHRPPNAPEQNRRPPRTREPKSGHCQYCPDRQRHDDGRREKLEPIADVRLIRAQAVAGGRDLDVVRIRAASRCVILS
jgi:hypothetical protein